jgi:hypothetical protein
MRGAAHWARGVAFVVDAIGDERHGPAGRDFFYEDDAAADFIANLAADVKAQVDFREVCVERHRDAEQADALELEANDTDVRLPVKQIGFRSRRCKGGD